MQPQSNFLSLLLQLSLFNPHTLLRQHILTLLTRLLELGSYPVHRLFSPSVNLIYGMMMHLCGELLRGELNEEETLSLVHLLTTMIGEAKSILLVNKKINMDVVQVLLSITANGSLDFASLALDSWLVVAVTVCSRLQRRKRPPSTKPPSPSRTAPAPWLFSSSSAISLPTTTPLASPPKRCTTRSSTQATSSSSCKTASTCSTGARRSPTTPRTRCSPRFWRWRPLRSATARRAART